MQGISTSLGLFMHLSLGHRGVMLLARSTQRMKQIGGLPLK